MASVYLTRNPKQPAVSNAESPVGPYQFYEVTYTTGTTQDWIYTPDAGKVGIVLGLVSAGTGAVEYTCSPPSVVEAGSASVISLAGVTATTQYTPEAITAFRVNRTSGSWKVSVRV
jgi:hypothetical protein